MFIFLQMNVLMKLSIIEQIISLPGKVVHSMNNTRVCWIVKRTVFIVYVCLSHSWRCKHNQFEKRDEKPRHQRQFFSKFRQHLYVYIVNSERDLFVPFIKYTLSKFYSHCTQNCKFLETKDSFLETKICFMKKNCSISS